MRILYAALLFMMMLVGAPAALAAPQISVGLVTGQFTAEVYAYWRNYPSWRYCCTFARPLWRAVPFGVL